MKNIQTPISHIPLSESKRSMADNPDMNDFDMWLETPYALDVVSHLKRRAYHHGGSNWHTPEDIIQCGLIWLWSNPCFMTAGHPPSYLAGILFYRGINHISITRWRYSEADMYLPEDFDEFGRLSEDTSDHDLPIDIALALPKVVDTISQKPFVANQSKYPVATSVKIILNALMIYSPDGYGTKGKHRKEINQFYKKYWSTERAYLRWENHAIEAFRIHLDGYTP